MYKQFDWGALIIVILHFDKSHYLSSVADSWGAIATRAKKSVMPNIYEYIIYNIWTNHEFQATITGIMTFANAKRKIDLQIFTRSYDSRHSAFIVHLLIALWFVFYLRNNRCISHVTIELVFWSSSRGSLEALFKSWSWSWSWQWTGLSPEGYCLGLGIGLGTYCLVNKSRLW